MRREGKVYRYSLLRQVVKGSRLALIVEGITRRCGHKALP